MKKTLPEHLVDGSMTIETLDASAAILREHPDRPELLKLHADLLAADHQHEAAAAHYARAADAFLGQDRPFQAWATKALQWLLQRPRPDQLLDFHMAVDRAANTGAPADLFVQGLTPPERMAVFARFQRVRVPGGRTLAKPGAIQNRLHFVVSGRLRESVYETVSQKPRPGREPSRILKEGDAFGDVYPFSGNTRGRAHVETVTRCELLVMAKSHLVRVSRRFPGLESGLLRLCGIRTSEMEPRKSGAVRRGERYAVAAKLTLAILPSASGGPPLDLTGFCSDLSVSGVSFIPETNGAAPSAADLASEYMNRAVRVTVPAGHLSLAIAGRIVRKRQVLFNGYRVMALGIRFAEMPPRLRGAFFAFVEGCREAAPL